MNWLLPSMFWLNALGCLGAVIATLMYSEIAAAHGFAIMFVGHTVLGFFCLGAMERR